MEGHFQIAKLPRKIRSILTLRADLISIAYFTSTVFDHLETATAANDSFLLGINLFRITEK